MLLLVTATVNTILLTNPCRVAFSCSVITLKICLQLYSFETFINWGGEYPANSFVIFHEDEAASD